MTAQGFIYPIYQVHLPSPIWYLRALIFLSAKPVIDFYLKLRYWKVSAREIDVKSSCDNSPHTHDSANRKPFHAEANERLLEARDQTANLKHDMFWNSDHKTNWSIRDAEHHEDLVVCVADLHHSSRE